MYRSITTNQTLYFTLSIFTFVSFSRILLQLAQSSTADSLNFILFRLQLYKQLGFLTYLARGRTGSPHIHLEYE